MFLLEDITKNGKIITENEEISEGKAHTNTRNLIWKCFDDHRCLPQSEERKCMWTHSKDGITWCQIHSVSYIFTLFWSIKTSVIFEIFQISFCVFVCAFPPEIATFCSKNFSHFFVLSILQYFPFYVVYLEILLFLYYILLRDRFCWICDVFPSC